MNPVIIIPARLASTRLPSKPLADIHGQPMIVHVLRRAEAAGCGPVYVAAGDKEIVQAVEAAGGKAVMTDPDLPSGTDRVRAAADMIDPHGHYDVIVNVQGDMPVLPSGLLDTVCKAMSGDSDIVTAAVEIRDMAEARNPNVVKIAMNSAGRALYFSRASIPHGAGPLFHHLGLYAYQREVLHQFCDLPPSQLEQRERLEQLRALEAGMRIDVVITDHMPLSVDTPEDLQRVREALRHEHE